LRRAGPGDAFPEDSAAAKYDLLMRLRGAGPGSWGGMVEIPAALRELDAALEGGQGGHTPAAPHLGSYLCGFSRCSMTAGFPVTSIGTLVGGNNTHQ